MREVVSLNNRWAFSKRATEVYVNGTKLATMNEELEARKAKAE